jgi:hypothetical protein
MRIFCNTIGGRDRDSNPGSAQASRQDVYLVVLSLSAYVMKISPPTVFPNVIPFDLFGEYELRRAPQMYENSITIVVPNLTRTLDVT